MKGLMLQDLYVIRKHGKYFLLLILMFSFVSMFVKGSVGFYVFYPILFICLLSSNLMAYDEQSHWNLTCETLPVSRKDYVTSKYLTSLIMIVSAILYMTATLFLRIVISGNGSVPETISSAAIMLCIGLIFPAVTLPFLFRFGYTNGRLLYGIIMGLFAVVFINFSMNSEATSVIINSIPVNLAFIPVIAAFIIYIISWFVSTKLYEKRTL